MTIDTLLRCGRCSKMKPAIHYAGNPKGGLFQHCERCRLENLLTPKTKRLYREILLEDDPSRLNDINMRVRKRRGKGSGKVQGRINELQSQIDQLALFNSHPDDTYRKPKLFQYIRVSDERQAESGLGLEAQRQKLEMFSQILCKDHDIEMGECFADPAVSAALVPFLERPAGKSLNLALRRGDHVVFAVHDRAFRSMKDFVQTKAFWEAKDVSLHFANLNLDSTTPMGQMIMSILVSFAEMESRMIGERTSAAIQAGRQDGRWCGMAPKGFKNCRRGDGGRSLRVDAGLHPWMRLAFVYKTMHGLTMNSISDALEWFHSKRDGREPLRDRANRYFSPSCAYRLMVNYATHIRGIDKISVARRTRFTLWLEKRYANYCRQTVRPSLQNPNPVPRDDVSDELSDEVNREMEAARRERAAKAEPENMNVHTINR